MGVRLSVIWNNGSERFECQHKYYGYEKLDTSGSYKYLHDILKVSEKEDPDMLQGLDDGWAWNAGPYTLTEREFKLFVELYCKDLCEVFPEYSLDVIGQIGGVEKLKDVATKPGDKQIEWG